MTDSAYALASAPQILQESPSPGLSLIQLMSIFKSYWKLSLIISLSIIVITAVYIKFLPKTYTATSTLIVNADNKDPLAGQEGLDGQARVAGAPILATLLANYIATQVELITSPSVLLPVVDKLNLTKDKEFAAGLKPSLGADELREGVEKSLDENLAVSQGKSGQLVYIAASARTPAKAALIANTVADVYLEQERRRVNDPAGEKAQRYKAEQAELKAKVSAAEEKVNDFRRRNGIADLTATNTDTEVQVLDGLENKLLDAQNQRRTAESKQVGQQNSTDEVLASAPILALKTQISDLETQLGRMNSTYGPQHPKVLELKAQIAAARRELAKEMQTLSENSASQLSRARDMEERYTRAVAEQRSKVQRLRQLQDDGGKLLLEFDSARAVYKRALDGYDQIMFASTGNNTNASIISRAIPPVKASKPDKLQLFLMAIIAGIALGLGLPFAYELVFNRRLRCRDDIERHFGIRVLAQFEPIMEADFA